MSCSVAMVSSPVFSPSRSSSSLFFKPSLSIPEASIASSSSSPPSPFRIPKSLTGLRSRSTAATTQLKRKRPGRLDIPIADFSFCPPESQSVDERKKKDDIEEEGDEYAVYCKRGKRAAIEDRYSAVIDIQGESKQAFFGIFDGHGGAKAAEFAAENLSKNIINEVNRMSEEDAIKHGYLTTDEDFLNGDSSSGGSCCVTALIRKGNLIVSNAGDCRAVMSRGGLAVVLTSDHRPSREDEKQRIEALGGYVDIRHGVWRIQGSLAVSRGIGDRQLKQWVIAEPETKIIRLDHDDEFLILASDGLWDKVSNQEAVDLVRSLRIIGIDACKKLVDLSVSRGSTDDTSVMLIQLGRYV